jgi:hypothetical protein
VGGIDIWKIADQKVGGWLRYGEFGRHVWWCLCVIDESVRVEEDVG